MKNIIRTWIVIFLSLVIQNNLLSLPYEIGFRVINNNNQAVEKLIRVYTIVNHNMVELRSGTTVNDFDTFTELDTFEVNGVCDLTFPQPYFLVDTNQPTFGYLTVDTDSGTIFYIRIDNRYIKITCNSYPSQLGDLVIQYNVDTHNIGIVYNDSEGGVTGQAYGSSPTWTEYDITLRNKFGGDYTESNVKGIIKFNDVEINDVGYESDTTLIREKNTFPHTISGKDDQYIVSYYRKWRYWNTSDYSSISKTLSTFTDYDETATYARKCNISVQNDFGASGSCGNIKFQSVQYSSPYQPSTAYEDIEYNVQALNHNINYIEYTFNYWDFNSVNKGSSNPYTTFKPNAHGTLKAKFNGKPLNGYRNLTINYGQYGQNVQLTWNKHPLDNSEITQYAIWRKVESNPATQIGTVNANGSASYSFTDYDYVISNSVNKELLKYDVRAYYSPSGTYPDEDWLSVYGEMMAKINHDPLVQETATELPTEYSISNYPNPFNPTTTIEYQLPDAGLVTLKVYDILGKEVAELVNETKEAGYYNIVFDASELTSGIYIYTIQVNNFVVSKKIMLVK